MAMLLLAGHAAAWRLQDATVVVSSFDEDVAWLEQLALGANVTVYNHVGSAAAPGAGAYGSRSHYHECSPDCGTHDHEAGLRALERAGATVRNVPNAGDEAQVILQYILDRYDTLSPVQVFLHGHQRAWHQSFDMAIRLREADFAPGFEYANLNNEQAPRCFNALAPHVDANGQHVVAWRWRLGPLLGQALPSLAKPGWCMFCCAQFAVEARAIRRHPRQLYERLLAHLLAAPEEFKHLEYFYLLLFAPDRAVLSGPELAEHDLAALPAVLGALPTTVPVHAVLLVALALCLLTLRQAPGGPRGKMRELAFGAKAGEATRLLSA